MKQIHGIFAVTVTHFQENGEIDYAACAKHINWLIESGVHGLLPLGATGEFSALTLEERKAFAEFAMKEVAGRVPVIIGAVSTNVDITLEVAKHAASIGDDGVMILPPPGLPPSQDEIYAFYKHMSENVTLPVMIYNNPGSSGVNILPETLDKIADLPHMGFLKESTGDIMRLTRAVDELADRLVIFCGCESLAYESFVNQGKLEEARALYRQILPLLRLTEETGELWQIVKYILKQRGFGTGTLRLPRQPISEGVKAQLDELLGKADFA